MKRKPAVAKRSLLPARPRVKGLMSDVRQIILAAQQTVAQGVNSSLVLLYWQIGQRIRTDILKNKRAGYGEQIFHSLSGKLTSEFGRGLQRQICSTWSDLPRFFRTHK